MNIVSEKDLEDVVRHIVGATVAFINAKTANDLNCPADYWNAGMSEHIQAAKDCLRRLLEAQS